MAKRDLAVGELLDFESGCTVSGGLRPAKSSVAQGCVPLGLAHKVKLLRAVKDGDPITWDAVDIDKTTAAYRLRQEMERDLQQHA